MSGEQGMADSVNNLSLQKGTVLEGRYEIIKLIKAGGMGAVYRAYDRILGHICAVKELLPSCDDEKATEWFRREAELLAGLNHPGMPKVTDYFIHHGRYYLVMNFIEGDDLHKILIKEGKPGLSEEKVIEIAIEILHILHYLHSQSPPVIYRDIKPSNIMIDKDGRVMLIDFGIARVLTDRDIKKTTVGTPGYAPLEQYRGQVEQRSDIYSLGATMHHLLTGIAPIPFNFVPVKNVNRKVSDEMESIVMKALKEEPENRFSSAKEMLKLLERLERGEKDLPLDWLDKGDMFFDRGKYEEAIKYYDKAIELDRKDGRAWTARGLAFHNKGVYKEALKCYDSALKFEPHYLLAWRAKGLTLNKLGKYKEAIACYDKAIELDPDDGRAWNNKGVILNTLKKYEKAVICYDIALNIIPDYINAWNNKGIALYHQGETEEALKNFYKAMEINPSFEDGKKNLTSALKVFRGKFPFDLARPGHHLCEQGRYEEAIEFYDMALSINGEHITALYNKGLALWELKKYDEALECYNRVLKLNPCHDMAWYGKGKVFQAVDDYDEAIKCYETAVKTNCKNKPAILDLAFMLNRKGRYEEALGLYDKALDIDEEDIYALNNKGFALYCLGKFKEALSCYDKVLHIDPQDVTAIHYRELAVTMRNIRNAENV